MADRLPIAAHVVAWGKVHGRHDLPWQHPATPYRVWLSEIMLQQTQVGTVRPYFERFVARFPTLAGLANAQLSEVLECWAGLGYYARARNLHRAARRCQTEHRGELPASLEDLTALPGIGRSTAGAILALAHDRRAAILDGNAMRVLARYHAVAGWPGKQRVADKLWQIAERETPQAEVSAYTQALMDLGATVCTRVAPRCARCPLAAGCAAHLAAREEHYPTRRAPRERRRREGRFAWIERDGKLLLEQRPPSGIWGGLLCLPELTSQDQASHETFSSMIAGQGKVMPGFSHQFTHFHLSARVSAFALRANACSEDGRFRWIAFADAHHAALPTPIRHYIEAQRPREQDRCVQAENDAGRIETMR